MYYDDHKQMEQEILRRIPIGNHQRFAKQVMSRSGVSLNKQNTSLIEFRKEEIYWPFYVEGAIWTVELSIRNGSVSDAKVWIGPGD